MPPPGASKNLDYVKISLETNKETLGQQNILQLQYIWINTNTEQRHQDKIKS